MLYIFYAITMAMIRIKKHKTKASLMVTLSDVLLEQKLKMDGVQRTLLIVENDYKSFLVQLAWIVLY